jgi:hypothetical protein
MCACRCRQPLVIFIALFASWFGAKGQIVLPGTPSVNFSSGFLGAGSSLALNEASGTGTPSLDGSKLELTDGGDREARSAYYVNPVDIAQFQTQFEFQIMNPSADGFTFCIQRDSTTATGARGGCLGYAGIRNSLAIAFNLYNPAPLAVSTTGLYTNGAAQRYVTPPAIAVRAASGIDFHSGHVMRVILTYVEGTLNEQITDLTTNAVFTQEYTIDIPAVIGATSGNPTAYVGFTAGTGGATSIQEILNWTFNGQPAGVGDVLKYRADLGDSGQYLTETMLSATNVNATNFGKLFSYSVDGQVYAQPLYKAAVPITTGAYAGTTRNVVFVATEHDSLYAFDADGTAGSGPLWQTSFINPANGVTTVPADDYGGGISPECGITSTPVIDPTTNTIYVCAKTKEIVAGSNNYIYRLHAINISNGLERAGSPVLIANTIATLVGTGTNTKVSSFQYVSGPTVTGAGAGSVNGQITFNALRANQRPALVLCNGIVYIEAASNGDIAPFHGWVLGYNATTLQNTAAWNDTPDGTDGGIWQSGAGLVTDSNGYLYCSTGNGTFKQPTYSAPDASYIQGDFGESCVKLAIDYVYNSSAKQNYNGWGLKVVDYFTPYNQEYLSNSDFDLGSGGLLLLPDSAGSVSHPHLLITIGKQGTIYMVDRDKMGEYNANMDHVVQELLGVHFGSWDSAAYYNNFFYYWPGNPRSTNQGHSFAITSGTFTPAAVTPDSFDHPCASPIVSGSGSSDPNAVVWCVGASPLNGAGRLCAYTASAFSDEIYTSDQAAGSRDAVGSTVHFELPIVVKGCVYVPTAAALVVYGLLR